MPLDLAPPPAEEGPPTVLADGIDIQSTVIEIARPGALAADVRMPVLQLSFMLQGQPLGAVCFPVGMPWDQVAATLIEEGTKALEMATSMAEEDAAAAPQSVSGVCSVCGVRIFGDLVAGGRCASC